MLEGFPAGKGRVTIRAPRDRQVTVWYHSAKSHRPDGSVLFVLHGVKRNAKDYLEFWATETEARGVLTLAPEFSSHHYPGAEDYNLGGVLSESEELLPRRDWSFSVIESVFDAVVASSDQAPSSYFAFGHSAGAQFLYRAILLGCLKRVERAVVANAGWYTLPCLSRDFPYGLARMEDDCRYEAFETPLLFLLGENDTDRDDNFRQTTEAMEQGENRLERGEYAYRTSRAVAGEVGASFEWELKTLPDVGHQVRRVVPTAAEWLLE